MKRWLKIGIGIIVVGIVAAVFLIDVVLEGIIKSKLQSVVQLKSDRIYDYHFDKIQTKFLAGEVILTGLSITPRIHVIDSLKNIGIVSKDIYRIELDQFRLEGLDSWRLILRNEISIHSIYLDHPKVKVHTNKEASIGPGKNLAKDILSPDIPWSFIDSFKMENARLEVYHIKKDTNLAVSFDSLNLSIYAFKIDSSLIARGLYFSYSDVGVKVKNVNIHSLPNYNIDLLGLHYDLSENEFGLNEIRIIPKKDKYEYMKTQKFETDWVSIKIAKLNLRNINFDKLHEFGKLELSEIEIVSPTFQVYRDKRLPDKPYKFVPLPTRALRELKFPFHVDRISVSDANVTYIEWVENAKQPGILKIDKMNLQIDNVGSDHEYLMINDTMKIKGSGRLFNSGNMVFTLMSSVLDTTDGFSSTGEITDLECKALNPLIENLAFVHLEEGKINYIKYEMTADNQRSIGVLDIDYAGIKKITFLRNKEELEIAQKGKSGKKEKKDKKLLSFLANTYLENDYNPQSKNYYQGRIHFDRSQNKAVFNYLLKSIMSGIQSCVLPNFEDDWKQVKSEKKKLEKQEKELKKKEKRKSNNN